MRSPNPIIRTRDYRWREGLAAIDEGSYNHLMSRKAQAQRIASAAPSKSQTDVVIDEIKAMITRGELSAGSRLPIEKDLAEALGVSRGSLREGVRALALLGVLESRQGAGTYVTALQPRGLLASMSVFVDLQSPEDVRELQFVRRLLETEAAGLAATAISEDQLTEATALLDDVESLIERGTGDHERILDADIEFHRIVAAASGNSTLEALIESFSSRTTRIRLWRGLTLEGADRDAHREHRAILLALQSHNASAARISMGFHLLGIEQYVLDKSAFSTPIAEATSVEKSATGPEADTQ